MVKIFARNKQKCLMTLLVVCLLIFIYYLDSFLKIYELNQLKINNLKILKEDVNLRIIDNNKLKSEKESKIEINIPEAERELINEFTNLPDSVYWSPFYSQNLIPEAKRLFLEALNLNKINEKNYFKMNSTICRYNELMYFVLGHGGSGTTLMRVILDVSPRIDSGFETRIIPLFLDVIKRHEQQYPLLDEFYKEKLKYASRLFILHLMNKNSKNSDNILCNKDPENTLHIPKLAELFPNSRFIYMVRDGRGAAFSRVKVYVKTKNLTTSENINSLFL